MSTSSLILQLVDRLNSIDFSLQRISLVLYNQSFWNTQLFGAIVGALFGLIPFFYLIYKDRPIIKLKANSILVPTVGTTSFFQPGLSITILNFGRRPVTIEKVFLEFVDGESLIFMHNSNFVNGNSGLPKILNEGSSHIVAIYAGDMGEAFLKKKAYPIYACYEDALGRVYRTKLSEKLWNNIYKNN